MCIRDSINANKEVENKSVDPGLYEDDPAILENLTSATLYRNVKNGVDLRYDLVGTDLKESILLHNVNSEREIQFRIKTKELIASQEDEMVFFKTLDGSSIYQMGSLCMYDSYLEESEAVTLQLSLIHI